jgi:hypothetical protein
MKNIYEIWDKRFKTEEIDEFRELVAASIHRQEKYLENEEASLDVGIEDEYYRESYRVHLEDRYHFTQEVRRLSDELAIVALFKQVELHTKKVAKKNFPSINENKLFEIEYLKKAFPFKVEELPSYAAFNELRLLNNAVKHQGKVSRQLSDAFPSWSLGADLAGLDTAYSRLHPGVTVYVQAFVSACYAQFARFTV